MLSCNSCRNDDTASPLTPASDIPSRSSLRSSTNCDLVVPRTSRKIGDMAFSVAASRAWNRLPTDLKLLRSTASFKSKLKSFLFHAAYTGNTVSTLEYAIGLIVGGALQVTIVTVTATVYAVYSAPAGSCNKCQCRRRWSRMDGLLCEHSASVIQCSATHV